MDSVLEWLRKLGLERYSGLFATNDVDLDIAGQLEESDLEKLGISLGDRKRLLKAIAQLNADCAPEPAAHFVTPAPGRERDAPDPRPFPTALAGERRQLTVMFCDMVGFTELANRVDPEVLQRIIRSYEDACAACITRYEGFVFQRLGDGIVAFFGYPMAHEDEAERSIRSALLIVESLARLDVAGVGHLLVRVGIATGLVVVSSSAEQGAVGDTMNLAARLQGMAKPGSILVSGRVHRLAGGSFDYEDLGEHQLKGIAQPVPVWRIVGMRRVESRFEAARVSPLTPLVGREAECKVLRDQWRQVVAGQGQVVGISGEAGIGKSRLARVIIDETRDDDAVWVVELQCSHFHTQSSLYPVADLLRQQIFRDEGQLDDVARWAAIETYLRSTSLDVDAALPLVAQLLSVPPPAGRLPSALTPERARLLTRQFLVSILIDRAKARPGILILEDLHWADPSTLDLVDHLIERVGDAGVLVLLTHRPEFDRPLPAQAHVTGIVLSRLRDPEASELVRLTFLGHDFAPDVLRKVIEKTDGVPLYIEEFTKAVVDSRHAAVSAAMSQVVIPASLHDSLLARLDRLGEAKAIAQLAAMLGREFSREVLAAVWPGDPDALAAGLERLERAEFIFPTGDGTRPRYLFKHALIQDAAYESLLKSDRVTHHLRIAEVMDAQFADIASEQPEVLAHHYAGGQAPQRAAQFWLAAGQQSLRRNAHVEAAAHLRSALAAVAQLPDTPQRALAELDVVIVLGTALVAASGFASSEVEAVWTRAQQLCAVVGNVPQQVPALFGLWMFECVRANHPAALELSVTIVQLAEAVQSEDLLIQAHLAMAASNFFLGNFTSALASFEKIHAIYHAERHAGHRFQFGQDPAAIALAFEAWVQWLQGETSLSLETSMRAVTFARSLDHPFTLSFVLAYSGWHRHYCREPADVEAVAAELIELCTVEAIPVFLAHGNVLAAGIRCDQGDAAGPTTMHQALEIFRSTGSRCFLPYWDALHADALSVRGDHVQALALFDAALGVVDATQERWAEPELHRLRGLALERRGDDAVAVETCHRRALETARALGARAWELRAQTSLAACLAAQGRGDEPHAGLGAALTEL